MKFLLGCNLKIVVWWGNKNLMVTIFTGGGRLSKTCVDYGVLDMEI